MTIFIILNIRLVSFEHFYVQDLHEVQKLVVQLVHAVSFLQILGLVN